MSEQMKLRVDGGGKAMRHDCLNSVIPGTERAQWKLLPNYSTFVIIYVILCNTNVLMLYVDMCHLPVNQHSGNKKEPVSQHRTPHFGKHPLVTSHGTLIPH